MNKSLSRRAFLRTSIASGASLAAAAAGAAPAGIYRPGTYSAKASGIGEVTVTMTFDADRIIDVVLDVSHETPGIGQAAADTLKKNLMAAQAAEIDGVSGATITSKAVSKAAAKCIAQAKGEIPVEVISDKKADEDDGDWLGKEPEIAEKDIVATHETDILVVGCGTGGLFAVAAAAEAGGKVIGIDRFAVGTGIREDLGAIDSRYQKAWGTKIDKFEFITMATQYAGGTSSRTSSSSGATSPAKPSTGSATASPSATSSSGMSPATRTTKPATSTSPSATLRSSRSIRRRANSRSRSLRSSSSTPPRRAPASTTTRRWSSSRRRTAA